MITNATKGIADMNTLRRIGFAAALALTLISSAALAATATLAGLEEAMSHDGLQKITVKGTDLAYARPGATLAGYNRVQLDPIQVSFRKDWDPTRTGSRIKLSTEEREKIRSGVATVVQEEFVKELQSKSSYKVVNEGGPDVLRVKVHVVNLYVNAPDTPSAGRSRTYTVSAGEMTLFAELFDSETGEILARVIDRREARGSNMMTLSDGVMNRVEAQEIASAWARILRTGLDNAHGIGKK
jgi:hypothetical protein